MAKKKANTPGTTNIPPTLTTDGTDVTISPHLTKDNSIEVKLSKQTNPEYEAFEGMVDEIRKAIRKTMDHQRKIGDTDPVTIQKKTSDVIKAILRASRWA